jgi:hypothetical protein
VTTVKQLFVPIAWPVEVDELLGTLSDRELGRHLNLDPHTIAARRRVLNLPAWRQPKKRHRGRCVVCKRTFEVVGGRLSQMRKTCPPEHRFTRAGQLSDCHKQLIARTLMITRPVSPRNLIKRAGGSSVVRLVGD